MIPLVPDRQALLTQLANIFRYFADLAPVGRKQTFVRMPQRSDFVYLDWNSLEAEGTGTKAQSGLLRSQPPDVRREKVSAAAEWHRRLAEADQVRPLRWFSNQPGLERLLSIDLLHSHEYILRLGWLWLVGKSAGPDAQEFALPLASATARINRRYQAIGGGYQIEILSDLDFPDGIADDYVEQLQEKIGDILTQVYRPAATRRASPLPSDQVQNASEIRDLAKFLNRIVGLGEIEIAPPRVDPRTVARSGPLTLCLAKAVYVDGEGRPGPGTMAGVLHRWAEVDTTGTAFERMYLPRSRPEKEAQHGPGLMTSLPLNSTQRAVLHRARQDPVTVVSGPPGTGKTHLVAAIATDEVARGNSVLIATQSDHAADVIAGFLDRHPGPRFVRFGRRSAVNSVADELAGGIEEANPRRLAEAERRMARAEERVEALTREVVEALETEIAFGDGLQVRQRLERIAGQLDPQVDDLDIGRLRRLQDRMRSGDGSLRRWLSRRARRALASDLGLPPETRRATIAAAVDYLEAERAVQEGMHRHRDQPLPWDQLEAAEADLRRARGEYLAVPRGLPRLLDLGPGQSVAALASVMRAGTEKRRRLLADLGSAFLGVLPLWVGTLQEIDATLPWKPAMFDLVIFDEASQINQVRAASALARAKRAVIVGDPRQLRHVSFVSDQRMAKAQSFRGFNGSLARILDVRRNSLFDVAASAPVTVLDEHFRSVPHIIGFSDRRFYRGQLRLMTQHPSNESEDVIRLVRVEGSRDEDGVNRVEVAAAAEAVKSLMEEGAESIGVISPFRAQADALEEMLLRRFEGHRLGKYGVRVGTVHAFQGAERHAMVMSLAIGAAEAVRSLRFVEDPHLLNVFATRARDQITLITSIDESDLPEGLLRQYLRYAQQPPAPPDGEWAQGWVAELAEGIAGYGLRVVPDYPVAGWTIDLAVGEGAAAVGVECQIHPDGPRAHIERRLTLRRAGWEIVDGYQSRWLSDSSGAVDRIVERVLGRVPHGPD